MTAPLVGGCLWLLVQTMGTPWELDVDGAILFFEDVELAPYRADAHPHAACAVPANSQPCAES